MGSLLSKSENESYKHAFAKEILRSWLYRKPELIRLKKILRIDIEEKFAMNCFIWFISDLSIYDESGLIKIIEIKNKHAVDRIKLINMSKYFKSHGYYPELIEISANSIIENTDIPKILYYNTINYINQ